MYIPVAVLSLFPTWIVITVDDSALRTSNGFNGAFPSIILYCDWLKLTVAAVK